MWFFAAALLVSFILTAFLSPKPKVENARASQLSDFHFPRAKEGDPVPRIYGTIKTQGVNTIGQCNFKAVPIKKKVKTGLFSSKKQIIGYQYKTGLDLGVCLGPGVVFRRMWYGKSLIWAGCMYGGTCENRVNINLPNLLGGQDKNGGIGGWIAFYCGNFDQTTNAYLQTNLAAAGDTFPAYPGVAHAVFEDFYWGNSSSIDTIAIEVSYFSNSLGLAGQKYVMANGLDANPIEVLYDLYINDWGNLGVTDPIFNLDNWRAIAYQIFDENNGISLEIGSPNSGGDVTKEILRQVNAMIYTDPSTGEINIKLMRQDYDVSTLPVLGPSQISSLNNFTKTLWEGTFNRVRVQYKDRANDYNDAVATADDFGNIRNQGRMKATDVGMPGVYVADLANSIAARELSNLSVPLYQGDITLDRSHSDLLPGGVFVLNWPEYGIANLVVRIRKMGMGTRKDGKITMFVVQDEFALDAVVMGVPTASIGDGTSYAPTDIAALAFVELPYWLDNNAHLGTITGNTRYMTFAGKPGPASIDYFAYIDDSTIIDEDTEALANAPYSAFAHITAAIDLFDGFATGVLPTLVVGTLNDTSILRNGSLAALQSTGQGLIYLNGEILGYETFVDNGDGTYNLVNVQRALMDTAPVSSAIGDTVFFFNGQEGFWDTDVSVAAFTAYLVDRAVTGRSSEASAPHAALVPAGRVFLPLPPDYVTLAGSRAMTQYGTAGSNVTFAWNERNRTAAAIAAETDATTAPEAGTTYTIEITKASDGTLLQTVSGIAAPTSTFALTSGLAPQHAIAKVWSVISANRSFTAALFPFTIITPDTLIVDGDPVLVDGETVEFS